VKIDIWFIFLTKCRFKSRENVNITNIMMIVLSLQEVKVTV
jgi:hypothetical protein